MPESHSVRPEDIRVDTFTALGPSFHIVDEDPVDQASGYDTAGHSLHGNGTAHI